MKISLLCSFLLIFGFSISQSLIEKKAFFFVDSLGIETQESIKSKSFIPIEENERFQLGYNKEAAIWAQIYIKNSTHQDVQTNLCFDNIYIDSIQFFDGNKTILCGDRTNKNQPFVSVYSYPISLQSNQEKLLLIRLKKEISFFDFSFHFSSEKTIIQQDRSTFILVFFFLGIIALLFIVNLILWFSSKEKMYFYYLIYSFLTSIYLLITTGIAKHIFFPQFLYFSELRIYIASLWFVALSLFLMQFLQIKAQNTRLHQFISYLIIFHLLLIVSSGYFLHTQNDQVLKFCTIIAYIDYVLFIGALIYAAIKKLKQDRSAGLYSLLAFMPMIIWIFVFIINAFGIFKKPLGTDWLAFSCLYEVFLFGFILSRNYVDAFRQKTILQQIVLSQKEEALHLVTQTQLKERTEIAHVLHDKFGSELASIIYSLEKNKNEHAIGILKNVTQDLRKLSHEIMPKSLENGALISSLKNHIHQLNELNLDRKIRFQSYDFPEEIEPISAQTIYLISLEIIQNAFKHGQATEVIIEFFYYSDCFVFQFSDNGIGFDPETNSFGFGLNALQARITSLNGVFSLNGVKNEGTIIQISLPFHTKNTYK